MFRTISTMENKALPRITCEMINAQVVGLLVAAFCFKFLSCTLLHAEEKLLTVAERFSSLEVQEVPDLQRHVLPLMGRLGCNGRACHGSFQGQGGFRLSMFGYDFFADHSALTGSEVPRVDRKSVRESLILTKPTSEDEHGGGKRFEVDDWSYNLLSRWIESGAEIANRESKLERLEIAPSEIRFSSIGEQIRLRVLSSWDDGGCENVTPLTRFQSNDEAIATVDADGVVHCVGSGDTHIVAFYDGGVATIPIFFPVSDRAGDQYPHIASRTLIDELISEKQRKLGIIPSEVCTDEAYLRRLSLDMTGQLPLPSDISVFVADANPDKRQAMADQLLSSPAYATWWATKIGDITGNNERYLDPLMRADLSQQWFEWLRYRIEHNVPYDKIVEGIVLAQSRRKGESFEEFAEHWSSFFRDKDPVAFESHPWLPYYWGRSAFRTSSTKALHFSYAFLGVRLQCAECHKHPFDIWTQKDFQQFTAIFDRVRFGETPDSKEIRKVMKESIDGESMNDNRKRFAMEDLIRAGKPVPWPEVFIDSNEVAKKSSDQDDRSVAAKILGGDLVDTSIDDPRTPLMEWLRSPDNPYFARAIVNRVWAAYFHRGIVDPVDDQNLANPPVNEELMEYLASSFIEKRYDLKWLQREIVTSDAYQRSWKPNSTNRLDTRHFSHAIPRRLLAEPLYDSLSQATLSDEDGLELHENPRRLAIAVQGSTAQRGVGNYALQMFGKPARIGTCDCERSNEPNLLQAIYLENDEEVLAAIERRGGWLHQVAVTLGQPFRAREAYDSGMSKRIVQMARELPMLLVEADKLKADGKQEEYAAKIERFRINRNYLGMYTDQELEELVKGDTDEVLPLPGPRPSSDDLIRQAYLRTLSRQPTEQQFAKAKTYINESKNVVVGLRDVLWTLINSQEFCVN